MALRIRPIPITADEIDSSSIAGTSPNYSGTAFYTAGDIVVYDGQNWESLTGETRPLNGVNDGFNWLFAGSLEGIEINTRVAFGGGGTLPGGLDNTTLYYVVDRAQNFLGWQMFRVSTTEGGSPVNITNAGSGERLIKLKVNIGNTPAEDSEHWVSAGPTNSMAAFDLSNATQSIDDDEIEFTITPGFAFDAIGFLNLTNVEQIQIALTGASEAYDETYDLTDTGFGGSEEFYFNRLGVSDLAGDSNTSITVTLTGTGEIAVGSIVIGQQVDIGSTSVGPGIGIDNYSVWERDVFGNIERTERGFSDRGDFQLFMAKQRSESLLALFTQRRAQFDLFFMVDDASFPGGWRPSGIIYGFVKSFQVMLEETAYSLVSVEIEGVT